MPNVPYKIYFIIYTTTDGHIDRISLPISSVSLASY
jgi:hypothetical protein